MTMKTETKGQIIAFYSYKGGTGRTMALANVACLLAKYYSSDSRILMIDWDLEAPGLHHFFHNKFSRYYKSNPASYDKSVDLQPGLIDLFYELCDSTIANQQQSEEEAQQIVEKLVFENFILETDIPSLDFLKAGCFDEHYSTHVNTFQWEELYNRSPWIMRVLIERLAEQYRYILIDSRTGLTDISGICTMLMPEKLVVVFTPNRQSLTGILKLIRDATDYRKESDDIRPLVVFPLPSRIEPARPYLHKDWRRGSREKEISGYQLQFENLFKEVYGLKDCDLDNYFDEVQIQHSPDYAYGEEIAFLVEEGGDRLSLTRSYENFVERLIYLSGPWGELQSFGEKPIRTELPKEQVSMLPQTIAFSIEDGSVNQGNLEISCFWKSWTEKTLSYLDLSWKANIEIRGELWCRFIDPSTRSALVEIPLGTYKEGGKYLTNTLLGFDPSEEQWVLSFLLRKSKP